MMFGEGTSVLIRIFMLKNFPMKKPRPEVLWHFSWPLSHQMLEPQEQTSLTSLFTVPRWSLMVDFGVEPAAEKCGVAEVAEKA